MRGCKALGGKSVSESSEETQLSREWIYEQKRRIEEESKSLDTHIKRMETEFKESALKNSYPLEAFSLFYQERVYDGLTWECSRIEYKLGSLLCGRYIEVREEFERILRSAKRASSMVENVNGRIRT